MAIATRIFMVCPALLGATAPLTATAMVEKRGQSKASARRATTDGTEG